MIHRTPHFDAITLPPLTDEYSEKTLFEQRCEGLQEELKERKRYPFQERVITRLKEKLDEEDKVKKQRMMTTVQLKHHVQNVVSKQMEEAEEVVTYTGVDT